LIVFLLARIIAVHDLFHMDYFLELFLGGLTRGSIYALIALGYTMVYGIIQLINFAHGEIYMIGAFTALIVAGVLTLLGGIRWRSW
jgi:branched-chain amino acid transport system permease protein